VIALADGGIGMEETPSGGLLAHGFECQTAEVFFAYH
jgi:hypothetical protein